MLVGHTASVKSVSHMSSNEAVIASGSRDGSIMLWDVRKQGPVHRIGGAHMIDGGGPSSPRKRKRRRVAATAQSVTSVLFLKLGGVLASSGAGDGAVKYWDVRNLEAPFHISTLPQPTGRAARPYGIVCLVSNTHSLPNPCVLKPPFRR